MQLPHASRQSSTELPLPSAASALPVNEKATGFHTITPEQSSHLASRSGAVPAAPRALETAAAVRVALVSPRRSSAVFARRAAPAFFSARRARIRAIILVVYEDYPGTSTRTATTTHVVVFPI